MGLDVVEIVMRTEEVFGVEIANSEAELIDTVGDLYRLVLKKLEILYQPASEDHGGDRSRLPASSTPSWKAEDEWVTLKTIIQDRFKLTPKIFGSRLLFSEISDAISDHSGFTFTNDTPGIGRSK